LSAVMAAALYSPKALIVIDLQANKLDQARTFGATHTINSAIDDVQKRVSEITGGRGLDFAIDAVGREQIVQAGFDSLAAMGTMLMIGTPSGDGFAHFPMRKAVTRGLKVLGTHQGDSIPSVVRFLTF
jgi:threonine dehydrogenase-like Zn-dependent dehydrogenase